MKVAVSLDDALFAQAESLARRLGLKRSQLYARAIAAFVEEQGVDPVTAKLDELAGESDPRAGLGAARQLIDTGAWEW